MAHKENVAGYPEHSPRRGASLDGDLSRGVGKTRGVGDGDGHGSARGNVDSPGERGRRGGVEGVEGLRNISTFGDTGEVGSCSTGPAQLCGLALDQCGRRVHSEGRLGNGQGGGDGGHDGERESRELHLVESKERWDC